MRSRRVFFSLWIGALGTALAAACGSSTDPGGGTHQPSSGSSSGGGSSSSGVSGGSSGGGSGAGSGSGSGGGHIAPNGQPIPCGPYSCTPPLGFCCIVVGGTDAGNQPDAAGGGEAGGARDAARGDAWSGSDAGDASDTGSGGDASAGGDADETGAAYSCASDPNFCAAGSTVLACADRQNCSANQACCGLSSDGGFVAQCAAAPCYTGKTLCVSNSGCSTGELCVSYAAGAVAYGICVTADAGLDAGD